MACYVYDCFSQRWVMTLAMSLNPIMMMILMEFAFCSNWEYCGSFL